MIANSCLSERFLLVCSFVLWKIPSVKQWQQYNYTSNKQKSTIYGDNHQNEEAVCVCACWALREISQVKNEQGEFLLSPAVLCRAGNRTGGMKPCLDSSALGTVSLGSVFIPSVLVQGHLPLLISSAYRHVLLGVCGWQSPEPGGPYGGSSAELMFRKWCRWTGSL